MKKERPILFSIPMVKALLAGRKFQTRRTTGLEAINEDPGYWNLFDGLLVDEKGRLQFQFYSDDARSLATIPCPYGAVGDVLYVKETFWQYGRWVKTDDPKKKRGLKWHPLMSEPTRFETDEQKNNPVKGLEYSMGYMWRKMPSLFLEQSAARIWLEITDIRVERVQDISDMDVFAEGVTLGEFPYDTPITAWSGLWISINGADSWQCNLWVWAITFRILSTTGKPSNI